MGHFARDCPDRGAGGNKRAFGAGAHGRQDYASGPYAFGGCSKPDCDAQCPSVESLDGLTAILKYEYTKGIVNTKWNNKYVGLAG